MSVFILKVKTKSGQFVLDNLKPTSTLFELKIQLSKLVNIPVSNMTILHGYPPKTIECLNMNSLFEANVKSGDNLIVEENESLPEETQDASALTEHNEHADCLEAGVLLRQVVPADNSCLFTSMAFVLSGKVDTTAGSYMRKIIAEEVANDEEKYSEAILGKPNKEYCKWIQKPESWGGAIELAALSHFYGIEIAVIDTMNGVINRFGEDKNYSHRVFIIFDGIHYDPLYRESLEPNGQIQTLFLKSNEKIFKLAEELAHEAKSSKQFTDVNRFTLRCLVCTQELTGQTEAQEHALATGHMNFGETSS